MMMRVFQDLWIGARILSRNWRLSAVVVLTIAVAVGATTVVMSFVSPLFLKALPFPDAARLYRLEPIDAAGKRVWVSVPTFLDWQRSLTTLQLAGLTIFDFNVFGDSRPESILAARITPHFIETLGLRLAAGRSFTDEDHRASEPRSVILTYPFWQQRYGGDSRIIGRTIDLSGPAFLADSSGPYRVVGVLAPDVWLFYKRLEIVIPLRVSPEQLARRNRGAIETVIGRLAPGMSPDAASAQLTTVVRHLSEQYGSSEPVAHAAAVQAQAAQFEEFRARVLLVLVSAALMFLLATLNIAAVLVAVAVARQREFAVRATLGASPGTLFRQTLVESAILGLVGGTAGLLLGQIGTSVFRTVVPSALVSLVPGAIDAIRVDRQVIEVVAVTEVFMAIVCAVVTFAATGGMRIESTLRSASRGTTDAPKYTRLRMVTLSAQLALAVGLVVTTSILSASLVRLQAVDLGVDSSHLVAYWVNPDPRRYASTQQRDDLFERIVQRVRAIPDVQSASAISNPITQDRDKTRVAADDAAEQAEAATTEAYVRGIDPDYFRVMGMPPPVGRAFGPGDTESTFPVAIVSRALAEQLWPDRNPISQRLRTDGDNSSEPALTVVGVAADVRRIPQEPSAAMVYRPLRQRPTPWLYVMVRTRNETADVTRTVRNAVAAEDPRQPIEGPYVMSKWVADMTAPLRFVVMVGLSFSVLGTLLALVGVYALTADLSQRAAHDIGIRKALGATTAGIVRLYMVRSARIAAPAVVTGAVVGTAIVRVLASQLETVVSSQPWVTAVVVAVFSALVGLATYVASRSAAEADPAVAMRAD
ncbi:MAG TPA: ABC transporter permease [Vicinamibacterales bacterium]|nr:ABC transporter permease [Vicinamibacterales bacterium]